MVREGGRRVGMVARHRRPRQWGSGGGRRAGRRRKGRWEAATRGQGGGDVALPPHSSRQLNPLLIFPPPNRSRQKSVSGRHAQSRRRPRPPPPTAKDGLDRCPAAWGGGCEARAGAGGGRGCVVVSQSKGVCTRHPPPPRTRARARAHGPPASRLFSARATPSPLLPPPKLTRRFSARPGEAGAREAAPDAAPPPAAARPPSTASRWRTTSWWSAMGASVTATGVPGATSSRAAMVGVGVEHLCAKGVRLVRAHRPGRCGAV